MDFYCITFKLSDMQPWFRSWDFSACKVSASDILQGHGAALARIFFQDFGGTVAPGPNSRSAKGEKIFGYLLP